MTENPNSKEERTMSSSKARSVQAWKKWYASGAVRQPEFPEGVLVVNAIGEHLAGSAAGFLTLSLGRVVVNSGNGWSVSRPICSVVVPADRKYRLQEVLPRLPCNAVPVGVFFGHEDWRSNLY